MAPSQCFGFTNLTLHGFISDHKESYYNSRSSSCAKALPSENSDAMSEPTAPSGNESEIDWKRKYEEERRKRMAAERKIEPLTLG
ncbi:hypothetical protein E4U17_007680, partial [Claviceps sp. LM77 group G4]